MTLPATITLPARFNGPPDTANGGYAAGRLAQFLPGVVEVTLRRPPPVDIPLSVRRHEDGRVLLSQEETLIAEARTAALDLDPPPPPTMAQAEAAARAYAGFHDHPFPTCYVCGPGRPAGDGMNIFAGPPGPDRPWVAAPWQPDPELADEAGHVWPEFVWAALDCPGAFAAVPSLNRPLVLGRITAALARPVGVHDAHLALAWSLGRDGRKHFTGSAVYTAGGRLCALARATWIELRPA